MKTLNINALAVLYLAASPLLFSSTDLDRQMSLADKEETGVVNLSLKQRQALGIWIDKHYVIIAQQPLSPLSSPPQAPAESPLTITANMQGGALIMLSNGSTYEIHPADTSISSIWVAPSPMIIEEGQDTQYPLILKNQVTQERIRARLQSPS